MRVQVLGRDICICVFGQGKEVNGGGVEVGCFEDELGEAGKRIRPKTGRKDALTKEPERTKDVNKARRNAKFPASSGSSSNIRVKTAVLTLRNPLRDLLTSCLQNLILNLHLKSYFESFALS